MPLIVVHFGATPFAMDLIMSMDLLMSTHHPLCEYPPPHHEYYGQSYPPMAHSRLHGTAYHHSHHEGHQQPNVPGPGSRAMPSPLHHVSHLMIVICRPSFAAKSTSRCYYSMNIVYFLDLLFIFLPHVCPLSHMSTQPISWSITVIRPRSI